MKTNLVMFHIERGSNENLGPFPKSKTIATRLAAIVVITAGWCGFAVPALAQQWAPSSIAAQLIGVKVLNGVSPFATNGNYTIYTSPLSSNFVVLGSAEAGLNWGTYAYTSTATNSGVVVLVDAQSGLRASCTLVFSSPSAGQMTLSNTGTSGVQTATFAASNYTTVAPANLYLPNYSNGMFVVYFGGQAGAGYTVDISSNLQNWSPLASAAGNSFADTNASNGGVRFYRARATSLDYAPNSIGGQSLNFAIATGAAPYSTNGYFQFLPDTSDSGYDMVSGPGMTNTSGTYQYAKIVPGAAVIASVNSQNASNNIRLVFTGPTAGFYYAIGQAPGAFEAGSFTTVDGPMVYLGKYNYTPDPTRAGSLYFAADGTAASLSVTDALLNVWTLCLPADALLTPQTITMTPTASVDSSGAGLTASAAVLLDPDGLQFADGVTLTLTTPAPLATNAQLMVTAEDGSGINLVATSNNASAYTTTLFHFSSGAVTQPTSQQLQALQSSIAMVKQSFNQAKIDAQNLEANFQPPSPPPDYDWSCDPETQASEAQAVNVYSAGLFAQEQSIIARLNSAAYELALLEDTSLEAQAGSVVTTLYQQDIFKKANYLVNNYGFAPTAFYGVAVATLAVVNQAIHLEIPVPGALLQNLALDGIVVGNYYLNSLTQDHDYSAISKEFSVIKMLTYLQADTSSLLASLGNALTFQLSLDVTADANSSSPDESENISLEAKGSFQITYQDGNLQGSGTCNYVSGMNIVSAGGGGLTVSIAPGQTFPETCSLVISSCPEDFVATANFTFNGFGSTTETWEFPSGSEVINDLLGITGSCFSSFKTSQGYSFLVELNNGSAQAVSTGVTGNGTAGPLSEASTLQLTLRHTPQ